MEISTELQQAVSSRQKGMCGYCGKKIDEISSAEKVFIPLTASSSSNPTPDQIVLVCNHCQGEGKSLISDPDYSLKKYMFPYAGFENYSEEEKIEDFRDDINRSLAKIDASNDIRAARNTVTNLIKQLRTFSFPKDIFDEFNNTLQTKLDSLIELRKTEYEKLEQEQTENYNNIKDKVDTVTAAAADSDKMKEARESLIKLQDEVTALSLKHENKDELLAKINTAFQDLNKRQNEEWERYEMECSENFLTLKPKVESAIEFSSKHPIFKECRQKLIEVQGLFKGLKLKKDNREDLYSKLQEAFTALNTRQDSDREEFNAETEANYTKIKPVVDNAIAFAKDSANYKQAREALIDAQASIKDLKLKKTQRDELYAAIRETFNGINDRQSAEREVFEKDATENYTKLNSQLEECNTELNNDPEFNKIRDILISVQGNVKILPLKRENRNQLFARIRELFGILDVKRKEYRENKDSQRMTKLNSILNTLNNRIVRVTESVSWDIKSLNFQREKLDNINKDEDQDLIKDINTKIEMFESRIKDKQSTLDDINRRIANIKKDIESITTKAAAENPEPAPAVATEETQSGEKTEENKTVENTEEKNQD